MSFVEHDHALPSLPHHAGIVTHVLRLEGRYFEALLSVVAAQRGSQPALASAAGGAEHHDALGGHRINEFSDGVD